MEGLKLESLTSKSAFGGLAIVCLLIWYISRLLYNVYFHPLAHFPGPKLAGATRWYEAYFDLCVGPGGQYWREIDRMHEKYVNFHETLYAMGVKRNKVPYMIDIFGTNLAIFGTEQHDLHRTRRAALNPFFSKRSVAGLESIIQSKVRRMCDLLSDYEASGKVLKVQHALTATIVDITSEYSFGKCAAALDEPDFGPDWDQMMRGVSEVVPLARSFPGIVQVAQGIPIRLVELANPVLAAYSRFEQLVRVQVVEIFNRYRLSDAEFDNVSTNSTSLESRDKKPDTSTRSIFHEILNSSLPEHEKTVDRMTQEALSVIAAASETTSSVLSTTIFHILANPNIYARLKQELKDVIPDAKELSDWRTLEALPYLTATIKEGLRITVSICSRLPLSSPDKPLMYTTPSSSSFTATSPTSPQKTYTIPPGTYVGMTPTDLLHNPDIYPSPKTFCPDRWLATTPSHPSHPLRTNPKLMDAAFRPFNAGPRMCIGLNLAYANMYHILAALMRRWELELYETERERDVDFVRDQFVSKPGKNGKGVRVRVVGERA
ncbi:uncharacterized protein KY384_000141 [Bacidia gigantensis]|uniref:uncharacterized protein n=1 Tax=Bacidia gigantensis TaxID=2732470 RepID=UPI001D040026|nr:uncharacterized protein KY384_000141 [Bacidia gigantensis]KAG8526148.1 hypothetical protein KY384_000141 [Bacidia gigantensis]